MAFVPGFDHDVFISYASADNTGRPGQDGEWVARFHASLSLRLRKMLGAGPMVYRDPKLAGPDSPDGLERLPGAATMVAILSSNYLNSRACRHELATFSAAIHGEGRRMFPVWIEAIEHERLPDPVADIVGYRFFTSDSGSAGEQRFRQTIEADVDPRYWETLDDLSRGIAAVLRALRRGVDAPEESGGRVVYLAETTADVGSYRDRLRRSLLQQGVTVLPATRLPRTTSEHHAVAERDLRRSAVSVHMLGRDYGERLSGSDVSVSRAQAELAVTVARETRLRRIVWTSPEARGFNASDERQREFQHWIESETPDELLEGGLEELKAVVFESLLREPAAALPAAHGAPTPPPAPEIASPSAAAAEQRPREVFISYSRADAARFAAELSAVLRNRGVRVWIDVKDIRAGTNFRRAIEEALYRCTHMLIVLSPKAVESDEVMGEVNIALDDKKPVVPVLYLPCRTPSYLRLRQHVNFTGLGPDDEKAVAAVLEALRDAATASR